MKRKERGANLTEYGIGLAVLVVVGIVAMQSFGLANFKMFVKTDKALHNKDAQANFNLIGADVGKAKLSGLSTGGMSVSIDPATGNVIIDSYGASNNTSADGEKALMAMSDQIRRLAENDLANGHPVSAEIQALLKQLAQHGDKLAAGQGWAEANLDRLEQVTLSGSPYNINGDVKPALGLLESRGNIADTYNKLMALMGDKPEYAALRSEVSDTVGAMSTLTWNNSGQDIMNRMDMSRVPVTAILDMGSTYPNVVGDLTSMFMQTGGDMAKMKEMSIAAAKADTVGTPIGEQPVSIAITGGGI